MNNLLHNATNVAVSLSIIERAELGRCFVVMGVRFELAARKTSSDGGALMDNPGRTMACERLCARITLPIVDSTR
jgi:hypothetical protein